MRSMKRRTVAWLTPSGIWSATSPNSISPFSIATLNNLTRNDVSSPTGISRNSSPLATSTVLARTGAGRVPAERTPAAAARSPVVMSAPKSRAMDSNCLSAAELPLKTDWTILVYAAWAKAIVASLFMFSSTTTLPVLKAASNVPSSLRIRYAETNSRKFASSQALKMPLKHRCAASKLAPMLMPLAEKTSASWLPDPATTFKVSAKFNLGLRRTESIDHPEGISAGWLLKYLNPLS